jgi:hypothetical protein
MAPETRFARGNAPGESLHGAATRVAIVARTATAGGTGRRHDALARDGTMRAVPKSASKPRRTRAARRPARGRADVAPTGAFWAELLATLRDLREQVQRLADFGEAQPPARRLDWARFVESRQAAAEGRERYWRDVGPAAAAK